MQHPPTKSTQTTSNTMARAYLEIILGPMFSGKTSKLTEIYKQCMFCNIPVAVINFALDTRYHDTMMSTHDKHFRTIPPELHATGVYMLYTPVPSNFMCSLLPRNEHCDECLVSPSSHNVSAWTQKFRGPCSGPNKHTWVHSWHTLRMCRWLCWAAQIANAIL
jgi:hypothetical protein